MSSADLASAPDVLRPTEVAALLRVSPNCVREMLVTGRLRGVKTGSGYGSGTRWLVPKAAVIAFLNGESKESTEEKGDRHD